MAEWASARRRRSQKLFVNHRSKICQLPLNGRLVRIMHAPLAQFMPLCVVRLDSTHCHPGPGTIETDLIIQVCSLGFLHLFQYLDCSFIDNWHEKNNLLLYSTRMVSWWFSIDGLNEWTWICVGNSLLWLVGRRETDNHLFVKLSVCRSSNSYVTSIHFIWGNILCFRFISFRLFFIVYSAG